MIAHFFFIVNNNIKISKTNNISKKNMQNAQKAIDFCKTGEYYQYISFRKFRNSCFRRVLEEELTKFGRKKKERKFIMRKFKKHYQLHS